MYRWIVYIDSLHHSLTEIVVSKYPVNREYNGRKSSECAKHGERVAEPVE